MQNMDKKKWMMLGGVVALLLIVLIAHFAVLGQSSAPVEEVSATPSPAVLTWQEQYDLGIRYLEDGNYEEAIIAFTAAITIDPKQAAVYIALADVYIAQSDFDTALAIIQQGLEQLPDDADLLAKLAELESGNVTDYWGNTRKKSYFNTAGTLVWYHVYEYDGNEQTLVTAYDAAGMQMYQVECLYAEDGTMLQGYWSTSNTGTIGRTTSEYDANGNRVKVESFDADTDASTGYSVYLYDESGVQTEIQDYDASGALETTRRYETDEDRTSYTYCYDADGTLSYYEVSTYGEYGSDTTSVYNGDGSLLAMCVCEYDANGTYIGITYYDGDGNVTGSTTYQ